MTGWPISAFIRLNARVQPAGPQCRPARAPFRNDASAPTAHCAIDRRMAPACPRGFSEL